MGYIINGNKPLNGTISVYGAKNCVLVLLAGSILTDEKVVLKNCKKIADVLSMIDILKYIGATVYWNEDDIEIDPSTIYRYDIPSVLTNRLRGSVFLLGALLGRVRMAKISMPGGCAIGERPIDIHIDGLRKLGAVIDDTEDIVCNGSNICGNDVTLRFASVGATENLIMCAVLAKGRTVLRNCATEPEVVALVNFLNQMGADVAIAEHRTIVINGVSKLHGVTFSPIPDRIVAATYMAACAVVGGNIKIENCIYSTILPFSQKLIRAGCVIKRMKNGIEINSDGNLKSLGKIKTAPYPGFATDMQSLALTVAAKCDGVTIITENLFENRLQHNAKELRNMGANIVVADNTAVVCGVRSFVGTRVQAVDLRGGAALVVAGMAAHGTTVVDGISHIERGYYNLAECFNNLGAEITFCK
ncbi:MAG: UDP-N-acetylglucosamine 1-carboxyvinyltransferase [Corallococcus sp.]|nr:UDP-N-acetylglucosamine 1-carboxyvinyltransferase [Corallococcus sp.]